MKIEAAKIVMNTSMSTTTSGFMGMTVAIAIAIGEGKALTPIPETQVTRALQKASTAGNRNVRMVMDAAQRQQRLITNPDF